MRRCHQHMTEQIPGILQFFIDAVQKILDSPADGFLFWMTVSDRAKNCCSFVIGRKHHDQADTFDVSGHQRSQDTILIRFCIVRSIQTVVTVRHPKDSDAALCMGSNIHTEQFFQLLLPFSSRRNAVTNDQSLLPFPATGQFRISGSNSFLCGIRCHCMICLFRCLRFFSMIRFYCHF